MKSKEVTEYIEKQKKVQKEICKKLRKLIFKTFPKIQERMAWGVPTYDHGRYYIAGVKHGVNLGFAIKGLSKTEIKEFEGAGKTMRHLKFKEPSEIDEKEIVKLLKLVKKKAECVSCVK